MILPAYDTAELLRDLDGIFSNGASRNQGTREMAYVGFGTASNAYKSAGLNIRLGIDSHLRTLNALTIATETGFHSVPLTLIRGVLTLGTSAPINLEKPDAAGLLVKAIFEAVESVVGDA